MELLNHSRKEEVHRTQAQNRKNIRRVDNKWVPGNRENCRDGIDCEHQIRYYNHHQHKKQQGSRSLAMYLREELFLVVILCYWKDLGDHSDDRILIGVYISFFLLEHLDPGVNEKATKDVNNPVKAIQKGCADKNHRQTHYQSAKHTPEENSVLKFRRNFEVGKDE